MIDLDNHWQNLQTEVNGKPAYIRLNRGLDPAVHAQQYPHELIVSVKLTQPDDCGLPTAAELAILEQFEDAARATLQRDLQSLLAVVTATDGFLDFIFYSSDPQAAVTRLQAAIATKFETMRVEVCGRADPHWTQYARFAGL